jgi:hypothetical protein
MRIISAVVADVDNPFAPGVFKGAVTGWRQLRTT